MYTIQKEFAKIQIHDPDNRFGYSNCDILLGENKSEMILIINNSKFITEIDTVTRDKILNYVSDIQITVTFDKQIIFDGNRGIEFQINFGDWILSGNVLLNNGNRYVDGIINLINILRKQNI